MITLRVCSFSHLRASSTYAASSLVGRTPERKSAAVVFALVAAIKLCCGEHTVVAIDSAGEFAEVGLTFEMQALRHLFEAKFHGVAHPHEFRVLSVSKRAKMVLVDLLKNTAQLSVVLVHVAVPFTDPVTFQALVAGRLPGGLKVRAIARDRRQGVGNTA